MTDSWPPHWLRNPISKLDAGVRHWDRASDLAQLLDEIAGSDEIAAGHLFNALISAAPPECRGIVIKLCADADALRGVLRTWH
jgi:hypothetical protein